MRPSRPSTPARSRRHLLTSENYREARGRLAFSSSIHGNSWPELPCRETASRSSPDSGWKQRPFRNRQMGQKGFHFDGTHVPRMPFSMKQDEAAHPFDVGFLSTDAVVLKPDASADLVQQAWRRGRHGRTPVTELTALCVASKLHPTLYADGVSMLDTVYITSPLTLCKASFGGSTSRWAS